MQNCSTDLKKVMVSLDLSDYSETTFAHALALAKALDGELIILNVINSRGLEQLDKLEAEGFGVSRKTYLESASKERTAEIEEKYISACQGVPARIVFRVGVPYQEILQAIKDEEAGLLVMGPRGHSSIAGALLGTEAEKVFRRATCPVVSVRGPDHCRLPE